MHDISQSFGYCPSSMHKQNQRNYASRWAKSKKLCIKMGKIKEIMHRDGQSQRNYALRWAKSKKLCIEMGN